MPYRYLDHTLYCDGVALADIAAQAGTPCYVYSADDIVRRYQAYDQRLRGRPARDLLRRQGELQPGRFCGCWSREQAGFDIVSGGELFRVLQAGGDPRRVVFSGVGKTAAEIEYALREGIHSFNCESDAELDLIDALAERNGVKARVAIRVNPDVDAVTHPYISTGLREHKFGIDIEDGGGRLRTRARGCPTCRWKA